MHFLFDRMDGFTKKMLSLDRAPVITGVHISSMRSPILVLSVASLVGSRNAMNASTPLTLRSLHKCRRVWFDVLFASAFKWWSAVVSSEFIVSLIGRIFAAFPLLDVVFCLIIFELFSFEVNDSGQSH